MHGAERIGHGVFFFHALRYAPFLISDKKRGVGEGFMPSRAGINPAPTSFPFSFQLSVPLVGERTTVNIFSLDL
jgi:hypothetical protein